jgi:cystathionine beta-lyase/cystathionine gamma-synthase
MNKTHTNLSQIVKDNGNRIDAHMWIEDDGNVIDYEDTDLAKKSAYGTSKIVRKEFPKELQVEVLKVAMEIYKKRKEMIDAMKTYNNLVIYGLDNELVGNCIMKVIDYKKLNKHAKIKIGSLGFIQPNGDIFYEWG